MTRLSKRDPAYWNDRLFRNAFIYKGRRTEVGSWSVKIQFIGRRKAFTLSSPDRMLAAAEACQIYQTILDHGWDAMDHSRGEAGMSRQVVPHSPTSPSSIPYDVEYWKHRLIHRNYPEPTQPQKGREFSVRIEYARTSHFFPLGTSHEPEAAAKAMGIYRTVVNEGWDRVGENFPRELSLALRWQDNPLAWTYTTFHTRPGDDTLTALPPQNGQPRGRSVVFIEPDAGIRSALAACTNHQEGFHCDATFSSAKEALREIPRRRVDIVLANHDLPDEVGVASFKELQRVRPRLVVLTYSVFADADDLFKSTPGGSVVYMLKRTSPYRLFEPIANLAGPVTRDQILSHVRDYFHRLSAMLPSGPPCSKLATLTPREHEILALLAKGDLVKEIAGTLGISNWTVQGHVKSIFEKLKVHSRTEAVVKYLQR